MLRKIQRRKESTSGADRAAAGEVSLPRERTVHPAIVLLAAYMEHRVEEAEAAVAAVLHSWEVAATGALNSLPEAALPMPVLVAEGAERVRLEMGPMDSYWWNGYR